MKFTQTLEVLLNSANLATEARSAVRRATELIASHIDDGDHAAISEKLREVGEGSARLNGIDHERLFTLTRAARAAGLFAASGPFEAAALYLFGVRARQLSGLRGHLAQAKFALAIGDIEQAARHSTPLARGALRNPAPDLHATLRYVDLVAGNLPSLPTRRSYSNDLLVSIVKDRAVLVYGPGSTDKALSQDLRDVPVARVLQRGVTWDSESDLANNRVDIAYANISMAQSLGSLSVDELNDIIDPVRAVVLKGHSERKRLLQSADPRIGPSIPHPQPLDGSLNMVPIMMWDLLHRGATQIYIAGASFYLGDHPYRAESRPVAGKGFGAGGRLASCYDLAIHNINFGRKFVKNFCDVGLVSGDTGFRRAIALSTNSFLAELDATYGVFRR